jgi:hypothetical protein
MEVRAPCDPSGVFQSTDPSHGAPSSRPYQHANEEEEPASDAPCHGAPEPKPLKHRQSRLTPTLRQKGRLVRLEAPSLDRCPLTNRFRGRLERGPATDPRTWPSEVGFRRFFALRYDEEGLDSAASASSRSRALGAARRLSTSAIETIRKHDLGTDGTPPEQNERPTFARRALPWEGSRAPCGAAKPSGHGSGAEVRRLAPTHPGTSRRACARRELRPNPIGSANSLRPARCPVLSPTVSCGQPISAPLRGS